MPNSDDWVQTKNQGVAMDTVGIPSVRVASSAMIDSRSDYYHPIAPNNLDYSVKASLTDGKAVTAGLWTDDAKAKACETLVAVRNDTYELIEDVTVDTAGRFDRTSEPNGTQYNFTDIVVRIAQPSASSVGVRVRDINNTKWIFYGSSNSGYKNVVYKCLNHHGMLVSNLTFGNDFTGSGAIIGGTYESFGYTIGHIYLENVLAGANIKIYAIRA